MVFERTLELWICLCAALACAGWVLSAFSTLGPEAYLGFFTVFTAAVCVCGSRSGLTKSKVARDFRKSTHRFRRLPPFLFLCLVVFSFIGAFAYESTHSDTFAYRLPRILHWLAEGRWHWIHTPDNRMNVVASGTEWLWAPMMLFTGGHRLLCLTSLISFLFLPGLLYALFVRLKVRPRLAWWWMWLLPAGYCYALQAGSLATDGYATVFALAAVVYAFKARERNNIYYLWISVLALGFATGTKQTLLLAVPLWGLAALPSLPLLRQRPFVTAAVVLVAALASYLPNALTNIYYAATWKGFDVPAHSSLWAIVGNGFIVPLENLLPPVFPGARQWNSAMDAFVQTPLGSHFQSFENFGRLYRGPSENFGALGLTTCALLFAGLVTFRPRKAITHSSAAHRYLWCALLILPWLMLPAFLAPIRFPAAGRYLAFFYPFLFAGPLYFMHQPFRFRWWRVLAYLSMALTLLTVALLRQRPLLPVAFTTSLVERFVSESLAEKARASFSFAQSLRTTRDAFHNALPPQTKVVGYICRVGSLEVALWKPFGSRRVWRFGAEDSPEFIRAKGVEYVLLAHDALTLSGVGGIENWLEKFQGELVFSCGIIPEPETPPETAYLIKLKRTVKTETSGTSPPGTSPP